MGSSRAVPLVVLGIPHFHSGHDSTVNGMREKKNSKCYVGSDDMQWPCNKKGHIYQ